MVGRWKLFHFQMHRVLFFILMFHLQFDECVPINPEGSALLEFRARVETDPHGVLEKWNASDSNPCMWFGVHCVDGEVQMLDLRELSLGGMLAPEIGKLSNLRALVLYKNNFSGDIPKEIAGLTMLELLDVRGNNLTGTIPTEIGHMLSLKHLLLCKNKFQESIPPELGKLRALSNLQYDQNLSSDEATGIGCINRKVGECICQSSLKQLKRATSFMIPLKGTLLYFLDMLPLFKFKKDSLHDFEENCFDNLAGSTGSYKLQNTQQHVLNPARRTLLEESHNLPAAHIPGALPKELGTVPSFGSGSFPAIRNSSAPASLPSEGHLISPSPPTPASSNAMPATSDTRTWNYIYVLPAGAFLTLALAMLCVCRRRTNATIVPLETGSSGQLETAFVTGVPRMTRAELETACEDFSNIISPLPGCTIYKGILSNGSEIAVASSSITSSKDWSKCSEMFFREKVEMFSLLNHKNFVNILGYCEEDEPFLRMMVFEYASCGSLFEHLHVNGVEFLDWPARVRIIMGVAYCLQYMHELSTPILHPNLTSSSIFLMEDYAAKIADYGFWEEFIEKGKISDDAETSPSGSPLLGPESNVYNFGVLLLEIISGKLPYDEKEGSLVNWAVEHLKEKGGSSYIIDSSLQSFKDNELDIICEVIMACIHQDPSQRPTMKEATSKLREVITISPEAAGQRLSPLWWAELEILSVEAG